MGGGRLATATRDLTETWHQTKDSWRDAKCQEFERTYIDPLLEAVQSAVPAIDELGRALQKIRHDCE